MADFPSFPGARPFGVLSTVDPASSPVAEAGICTNVTASTAGAWPTANLAVFFPVLVDATCTAYQMAIVVGTQSGNVDVGIYNETGTRLVSSGSTAVAATGVQTFNITDTVLSPGVYFLAMACDNTTATFNRSQPDARLVRICGGWQQTTAFALPSTFTLASAFPGYMPALSASIVATI